MSAFNDIEMAQFSSGLVNLQTRDFSGIIVLCECMKHGSISCVYLGLCLRKGCLRDSVVMEMFHEGLIWLSPLSVFLPCRNWRGWTVMTVY